MGELGVEILTVADKRPFSVYQILLSGQDISFTKTTYLINSPLSKSFSVGSILRKYLQMWPIKQNAKFSASY